MEIKKRIKELEWKLARLQTEISRLEAMISAPPACPAGYVVVEVADFDYAALKRFQNRGSATHYVVVPAHLSEAHVTWVDAKEGYVQARINGSVRRYTLPWGPELTKEEAITEAIEALSGGEEVQECE